MLKIRCIIHIVYKGGTMEILSEELEKITGLLNKFKENDGSISERRNLSTNCRTGACMGSCRGSCKVTCTLKCKTSCLGACKGTCFGRAKRI